MGGQAGFTHSAPFYTAAAGGPRPPIPQEKEGRGPEAFPISHLSGHRVKPAFAVDKPPGGMYL
ncbi:hypothetical protein DESUT3_35830 [Desulfuromonas versatilis]|uniref:Uncharacterized protein n=1 Tax=Desulfuromonas versatilis TaxID=2802975 RepID=A0ABM8HWW6_9BACT|nr:hypothetical protein DESUT3_35830 [Desulfuromonas versatilis]